MVTTKGSTVLHSVLYVSTAQVLFTAPRMEELLAKSRTSNARQQITGLLLYRDGAFMQFLEGPEGAVERLFRRIKADEMKKCKRFIVEHHSPPCGMLRISLGYH